MFRIIFILLLMPVFVQVHAQNAWELRKDKNGIKIFTARQNNSNYRLVKVECMVEAKLSQLIALLFDIDKHHEWVYDTKSSAVCKKLSDSEMLYYSEVSVPWPFCNRDFVAHLKVCEKSPRVLSIESHAEPDYLCNKKNCVRVRTSDSYWTITSLSDHSLKIEYIIKFDPGGAIPGWLINMFITDGPYETFKNLKERVHASSYQNAHYSFIKE